VSFEANRKAPGLRYRHCPSFVDFIVPIETPEQVSGLALTGGHRCARALLEIDRLGGLRRDGGLLGTAQSDRSYSRLRSGMQLVDRRGAADAEELSAFGAAIERAPRRSELLRAMPDPASALAKARELDRFLRRGRHPGCRPYRE